jgi:hypothetical protein
LSAPTFSLPLFPLFLGSVGSRKRLGWAFIQAQLGFLRFAYVIFFVFPFSSSHSPSLFWAQLGFHH